MDPQRPYAQLLTPIAKSLKLLRRARHHRLVDSAQFAKHEAIYRTWQKLSAKGIAACPASFAVDLLIFTDRYYIGVVVDGDIPTTDLEHWQQERIFDGFLAVHTHKSLVKCYGKYVSMQPGLFDYLGQDILGSLSKGLSSCAVQGLGANTFTKVGQAAAFVHILPKFPCLDLAGYSKIDLDALNRMLLSLFRNKGQWQLWHKWTRDGNYEVLGNLLVEKFNLRIKVDDQKYVIWD